MAMVEYDSWHMNIMYEYVNTYLHSAVKFIEQWYYQILNIEISCWSHNLFSQLELDPIMWLGWYGIFAI